MHKCYQPWSATVPAARSSHGTMAGLIRLPSLLSILMRTAQFNGAAGRLLIRYTTNRRGDRLWSVMEPAVRSLSGCAVRMADPVRLTLMPSGSAATAINTGRRMGLFWIPQQSTIFCGILSAMDLGERSLRGDRMLHSYAHSISIFPVRFNGHPVGLLFVLGLAPKCIQQW